MHELKGIRDPVAAFSVLDTREVESRYLARQRRQAQSLVGREAELRGIMQLDAGFL